MRQHTWTSYTQHDLLAGRQSIVIHPESGHFQKYEQLARENDFMLEVEFRDLIQIQCLGELGLCVHGSNNLTYEQFLEQIQIASFYNPKYIVFHDCTLLWIFSKDLPALEADLNVQILVENTSLSLAEYSKAFEYLNTKIPGIWKCIDTWHANLQKDKISDWFDERVIATHIHNNFGKVDSHSSLWEWTLDFCELAGILWVVPYLSLETDVSYTPYVKNILALNKLVNYPNFNRHYLNLPLSQESFLKKLNQIICEEFQNNLCYAFVYWSFARNELKIHSDVDLVIVLDTKIATEHFSKRYYQLCKEWDIVTDLAYPFELFTIDQITIDSRLSSEDYAEMIYVFLGECIYVAWQKQRYREHMQLYRRELLNCSARHFDKQELKLITRAHVVWKSIAKTWLRLSDRYKKYYVDKYLFLSKNENDSDFYRNIDVRSTILWTDFPLFDKGTTEKLRNNIGVILGYNPTFLPILSTEAFLNPDKDVRLIMGSCGDEYVIVKINKPDEYVRSMNILASILQDERDIRIVIPKHIFLEDEKTYFFLDSLGATVEDDMKNWVIPLDRLPRLLELIKKFQVILTENGLVFWSLAPRNLFFKEDILYIIDFEKLFFIDTISQEKIDYISNFQRIWFSDCFNVKQINWIFWAGPIVKKGMLVVPDEVEKIFFWENTHITAMQREGLLKITRSIEMKLSYKTLSIYWHGIGQFLSDNTNPEAECLLLANLCRVLGEWRHWFIISMALLDYAVDILHESAFLGVPIGIPIEAVFDSYYKIILNSPLLSFVEYLLEENQLNKELPFEIRLACLKKILAISDGVVCLKKSDVSQVVRIRFGQLSYVLKIAPSCLSSESKATRLVSKWFNFTNHLRYSKKNGDSVVTVFDDLWEPSIAINTQQASECAKILVQMHRKELVSGNNFPTDIYFDFSELTIFTVCERLAEYVPSFSKMLFKQYLRELGVSYEKMPHNSLIHNDLYVDQFHFSQKTTLLDWNFLSRSSPVVDLASILRNDYDTRNGNFNKVAFLKAYMHHSASVFELKDLETWFYLNSYRDILWFIKRIESWYDNSWLAFMWLEDAYNELILKKFNLFFDTTVLNIFTTKH